VLAFFRRKSRPRFRFSGHLPRDSRYGILLPSSPLLAAFVLDVVATLSRHAQSPPYVLAPAPIPEWQPFLRPRIQIPEDDLPAVDLLVDLDPEGRTPSPAPWKHTPLHLSLHERGSVLLQMSKGTLSERWKQGLALFGVDWHPMHLDLPEQVRRAAITHLERVWHWKRERVILWELESPPEEPGWLFLHGEQLQQQSPELLLALATLSQGYVGQGPHAWVVHRAGHPTVLSRLPAAAWHTWLGLPVWQHEPWETVRTWLTPR